MYDKLRRIRESKAEDDRGFTLIELLVVVVIIGILVAIAIPIYLNYQKDAQKKSVKSDIRNAVTAIEACYSQDGTWPAMPDGSTALTETTDICSTQQLVVSDGNSISFSLTGDVLTINGSHGSDPTTGDDHFAYDGGTGKIS